MSDKPKNAPLRAITSRDPFTKWDQEQKVTLECGHTEYLKRGQHPMKTRCWTCYRALVAAWEAEHTCPHGVIEPNSCSNCETDAIRARIPVLESKIVELQTSLTLAREARKNWEERAHAAEARVSEMETCPSDDDLEKAVYDILDDLLICTRVWDAWEVGTMSDEDFRNANDSESVRHDAIDILRSLWPRTADLKAEAETVYPEGE